MTNKNGDVYEGGLKYGLRNGKGKMTYANGEVFKGEWKNNKKHGQGYKYIYKNGAICKVRPERWEKGELATSDDKGWRSDEGEMEKLKAKILEKQTSEFNTFKDNFRKEYQMDERMYDVWEKMYKKIWDEYLKKCDSDMCACAENFDVVANNAKDLANKVVKTMIVSETSKKRK